MFPYRWVFSLLGLLASALFAPGAAAQTTLAVSAEGWDSLWVQRGNSPVWDAVWRRGGDQVVTVMEGSVRGGQVALRRVSSSDGALCEYRGSVGGDGQAAGTQSCPGHANTRWSGQLQGRGAPGPGGGGWSGGGGAGGGSGAFGSLSVNADGWTSVWRQRGNSGVWDAVWVNGNQRVTTVMQGTVRGDQIDLRRTTSSDGAMCSYRGTVAADRRSVSGVQACPGHGETPWYGQFGDAGAGPAPLPALAPTEPGTVYRVENLAFGEAERGASPQQQREFVVDAARCTVRELNTPTEQGRQQVRVSLCQPNRRLAFSTLVRGEVTAEYDWVFHDGARQAVGAWRDRSGSGPSIGATGARRGQ
jgi:hypothetical protein